MRGSISGRCMSNCPAEGGVFLKAEGADLDTIRSGVCRQRFQVGVLHGWRGYARRCHSVSMHDHGDPANFYQGPSRPNVHVTDLKTAQEKEAKAMIELCAEGQAGKDPWCDYAGYPCPKSQLETCKSIQDTESEEQQQSDDPVKQCDDASPNDRDCRGSEV